MKRLPFLVLALPVLLTAFGPKGDEIRANVLRRDAVQPQDTATWKDFSSQAGWSIRYPPTWVVWSCANASDPRAANITCVVFGHPSGEGVVRVHQLADRPTYVNPARWMDHIKRTTNGDPIVAEDTIFVGGGRGLQVQYSNPSGGPDVMTTYVIIGARTFALVADPADDSIYARMVRTFRVRLL